MPRRSRVALGLVLVVLAGFQGSAEPRAPEGLLGTFDWNMRNPAFGGISAIEVAEDGQSFWALGDKGVLLGGTFLRDAGGQITEVIPGKIKPLRDAKSGKRLAGRKANAEGLAVTPSGQAFVSFEISTRVARLDLESAEVRVLPLAKQFENLPENKSLEALAAAAGPTLYAVPENPTGDVLPVYRWTKRGWNDQMALPRRGRFLPVAADIGPDGRFYLLERDFRAIAGFASRLRRFDLGTSQLSNEITLFETSLALHDNLEGLSIWRDEAGHLRATMVSDDNFMFLQQTQIVEYRLPD